MTWRKHDEILERVASTTDVLRPATMRGRPKFARGPLTTPSPLQAAGELREHEYLASTLADPKTGPEAAAEALGVLGGDPLPDLEGEAAKAVVAAIARLLALASPTEANASPTRPLSDAELKLVVLTVRALPDRFHASAAALAALPPSAPVPARRRGRGAAPTAPTAPAGAPGATLVAGLPRLYAAVAAADPEFIVSRAGTAESGNAAAALTARPARSRTCATAKGALLCLASDLLSTDAPIQSSAACVPETEMASPPSPPLLPGAGLAPPSSPSSTPTLGQCLAAPWTGGWLGRLLAGADASDPRVVRELAMALTEAVGTDDGPVSPSSDSNPPGPAVSALLPRHAPALGTLVRARLPALGCAEARSNLFTMLSSLEHKCPGALDAWPSGVHGSAAGGRASAADALRALGGGVWEAVKALAGRGDDGRHLRGRALARALRSAVDAHAAALPPGAGALAAVPVSLALVPRGDGPTGPSLSFRPLALAWGHVDIGRGTLVAAACWGHPKSRDRDPKASVVEAQGAVPVAGLRAGLAPWDGPRSVLLESPAPAPAPAPPGSQSERGGSQRVGGSQRASQGAAVPQAAPPPPRRLLLRLATAAKARELGMALRWAALTDDAGGGVAPSLGVDPDGTFRRVWGAAEGAPRGPGAGGGTASGVSAGPGTSGPMGRWAEAVNAPGADFGAPGRLRLERSPLAVPAPARDGRGRAASASSSETGSEAAAAAAEAEAAVTRVRATHRKGLVGRHAAAAEAAAAALPPPHLIEGEKSTLESPDDIEAPPPPPRRAAAAAPARPPPTAAPNHRAAATAAAATVSSAPSSPQPRSAGKTSRRRGGLLAGLQAAAPLAPPASPSPTPPTTGGKRARHRDGRSSRPRQRRAVAVAASSEPAAAPISVAATTAGGRTAAAADAAAASAAVPPADAYAFTRPHSAGDGGGAHRVDERERGRAVTVVAAVANKGGRGTPSTRRRSSPTPRPVAAREAAARPRRAAAAAADNRRVVDSPSSGALGPPPRGAVSVLARRRDSSLQRALSPEAPTRGRPVARQPPCPSPCSLSTSAGGASGASGRSRSRPLLDGGFPAGSPRVEEGWWGGGEDGVIGGLDRAPQQRPASAPSSSPALSPSPAPAPIHTGRRPVAGKPGGIGGPPRCVEPVGQGWCRGEAVVLGGKCEKHGGVAPTHALAACAARAPAARADLAAPAARIASANHVAPTASPVLAPASWACAPDRAPVPHAASGGPGLVPVGGGARAGGGAPDGWRGLLAQAASALVAESRDEAAAAVAEVKRAVEAEGDALRRAVETARAEATRRVAAAGDVATRRLAARATELRSAAEGWERAAREAWTALTAETEAARTEAEAEAEAAERACAAATRAAGERFAANVAAARRAATSRMAAVERTPGVAEGTEGVRRVLEGALMATTGATGGPGGGGDLGRAAGGAMAADAPGGGGGGRRRRH